MKNLREEKVERHLSTNGKQTSKAVNPELKGIVTIEGEYATLNYERRLSHPREIVWKAITDPKELAGWMNTKAVIDRHNSGTIDFVSMSGTLLLIQVCLVVNLRLLFVGSSNRMAIQIIHSLL